MGTRGHCPLTPPPPAPGAECQRLHAAQRPLQLGAPGERWTVSIAPRRERRQSWRRAGGGRRGRAERPQDPLPTHRGDVMTSSAFWAPPLVRGHPWWDQDAAFLLRPPGHRLVSEKVALPRLVAHSRTPQLVPPADSALARRRARRGVRAEASSGVGEVAQAERRTVQGPLLVRSPRRAVSLGGPQTL